MKIKERYESFLQQRWPAHKRAAERLEALESTGVPQKERLGDSGRRAFLAMADHQVDAACLPSSEIHERIRALYEGAQVLFASKRQAIVRVGELVIHCNRFGVCTFLLPEGFLGEQWRSVQFAPNYDCDLPESIGAVVDGWDGADRLHNYSACRPVAASDERHAA